MKKKYIKDNRYNCHFTLVWDCEMIDIIKDLMKKYPGAIIEPSHSDGCLIPLIQPATGTTVYYIWLRKFDWCIAEHGLLVHEVYHFVQRALKDIGMKPTESSEEAYAYYFDYIYQLCLEALKPNHYLYAKRNKSKGKPKGKGGSRAKAPRRKTDKNDRSDSPKT